MGALLTGSVLAFQIAILITIIQASFQSPKTFLGWIIGWSIFTAIAVFTTGLMILQFITIFVAALIGNVIYENRGKQKILRLLPPPSAKLSNAYESVGGQQSMHKLQRVSPQYGYVGRNHAGRDVVGEQTYSEKLLYRNVEIVGATVVLALVTAFIGFRQFENPAPEHPAVPATTLSRSKAIVSSQQKVARIPATPHRPVGQVENFNSKAPAVHRKACVVKPVMTDKEIQSCRNG